jgi:Flp pilus assembly pilin Flp
MKSGRSTDAAVTQLGRLRVDQTHPLAHLALRAGARSNLAKGGEFMSFKDLVLYLRARYAVEEGQTMAEYGVVLAVIAIGVVVALGLLSTSISGALDSVRSSL